jgi:predicted  nucleic acid-binding Zn-ribbon protein
VTPRDQLLRLMRIQELVLDIRAAAEVVESAPGRIEQIETRFRERNAEYVAVKDRHDELDRDQRVRSGELGVLEEKLRKFMDDLMQVKNQREYSAMLKEIDTVKAQIGEHEEAILKDIEEIETLKGELAAKEEHIAREREAVGRERSDVESEAARARDTIDRLGRSRDEIEGALPGMLRDQVRQLELRRQGVFLARADKGTCQACYVRIRPQVFQEIRQAIAVHTCDSCRRLLVYEPALRERSGGSEGANRESGVEALNGGAV